MRTARTMALAALIPLAAHSPQPREFDDLFNGRDLSGWDGNPAIWSVQNGAITGRTTAANTIQRNTFLIWKGGAVENFELRLMFRITGDNERGIANSGIQYRSRVVDMAAFTVAGYQADFDLPGNYVGMLYEELGRGILARPRERVRLRPRDWNDYVIVVEGNRHRLYVNGTLTVDTLDLDESKAARSGIVALQLHHGLPMTVQFKDIRLKRLPATPAAARRRTDHSTWRVYGGSLESNRYSSLTQINRDNVRNIKVAWTFDVSDGMPRSELQVNPIVIDGVLYATTVNHHVIALNAETGELLWRFDPYSGRAVRGGGGRTRGVMYWESESGDDKRIFVGVQQFLYALDAKTGRPVATFGSGGRVDMRDGLRPGEKLMISLGTPGVVYKDLLILGSRTGESLPTPPGDIRAFDARTGEIRWTFHTVPRAGEFGYETWPVDAWTYIGAANNWAGMSVDVERGLVFVPTGSAADDYYGANRVGDNLFANSLIALDASTGKRVWHFQFVRHDLWDRDLPAPPNLVTVQRDGRSIAAVAQITKSGHVFLFERETGAPLFPIEYKRYAKSDVPGEVTADSQPFPVVPAPFARQAFTKDSITNRTPEARRAVLQRVRDMRTGGQFVPPSLEGTVVFPGLDGGGEWGGAAFDAETSILYVNSNEMPWYVTLVPNVATALATGQDLYMSNCAGCHGADLAGSPPTFPSLLDVSDRLTPTEVRAVIADGTGRMAGFTHLGAEALSAIQRYVQTRELAPAVLSPSPSPVTQMYRVQLGRFLDPDGYPAVKPPWGTLNAINLSTGEYVWRIPFGEYPDLVAKGMRNTGSENYGGPVVTAGGLLFIGATNFDRKFRAFDKATGELLWETTMPGSGNATPAVYEVNGRQFIVIAASHGKSRTEGPSMFVAFALDR